MVRHTTINSHGLNQKLPVNSDGLFNLIEFNYPVMMLVTVVSAGAQTGKSAIRALLKHDVQVNGVFRNPDKAPSEFTSHPRFTAVQGDVSSTLDLTSADVVIVTIPPVSEPRDIVTVAKERTENVKAAVEKAGTVKRIVLLTSVGAQFSTGVGEIKKDNMTERVISTIAGPELVFVRCAYFMENWTSFIDPLKAPEPFFYSTITPLDWQLPMVAVQDIGDRLASEAVKSGGVAKRPLVLELHGPDRYSPLDVQQALTDVLGKKVDVKSVAKEDLRGFFGAVFPEVQLDDWVEMAMSNLPGGKLAGGVTEEGTDVVYGKTTLREAFEAIKTRL